MSTIMTNLPITLSLFECFEISTEEINKPSNVFDFSKISDSIFKEKILSQNINLEELEEFVRIKPKFSMASTSSFGGITNINRFSFQTGLSRSNELSSPSKKNESRESSQSPKFNVISDHLKNFNGFVSNFNVSTTPTEASNAELQESKRKLQASILFSKSKNQSRKEKSKQDEQINQNSGFSSVQNRISFAP